MRMQSNRYTAQAELDDHVIFKATIDIMIHNNKYGGIEASLTVDPSTKICREQAVHSRRCRRTSFTARTEGSNRLSGVL